MGKQIKFIAAYGEKDSQVILSQGLDENWDILIDNYYYGSIVKYMDGWGVNFHYPDATEDDKDALLDRVGISLDEKRPIANFTHPLLPKK